MIKLDCKFSNADKLWWKRVNEGQESPSKISGESTNSLTIQSVQKQDDGEYRCYGSNNFDRKYGTITISSWCKYDQISLKNIFFLFYEIIVIIN